MFQIGSSLITKPIPHWASRLTGLISSRNATNSTDHNSLSASELNKRDAAKPDDLFRYLHIKCSGNDQAVLDSYERFLTLAAKHLDIEHINTETPFRIIKRRTLLASRFVHKKYRVQYELRTYMRNLTFKNLTESTVDTFLEYVERNIPEGVLFEAEKHKLSDLPFELKANKKSV